MFSNLIRILSCGVRCRFSDLDSLLWSTYPVYSQIGPEISLAENATDSQFGFSPSEYCIFSN